MGKHPANTYNLVADIGGTNTRVALAKGRNIEAASIRKYPNDQFPSLEAVLRRYIEEEGNVDCAGACVAVAGPVRGDVGEMTNLDWKIDKDTLQRATQAETVAILNDLQAQGHALGYIAPSNIHTVLPGTTPKVCASQLVIGVGTGFNAALVLETAAGRIVTPSESGHISLPIRNDEDCRLYRFLEAKYGFPAVEDVLSGRGLERLYRWLAGEAGRDVNKSAAQVMAALDANNDPIAKEAVQIFVQMLGTVAGNLSLIQLPFGGVYLIGGVARAMTPYLAEFGFGEAFCDKGRFAEFMQSFPVSVIEDDFAALTGCASHLMQPT